MKYPVTLIAIATAMLLVGVGIRIHADWKLNNKLYYHTVASQLYDYDQVFAERKLGDAVQLWSIVGGGAGGVWFVILKLREDQKRLKTE